MRTVDCTEVRSCGKEWLMFSKDILAAPGASFLGEGQKRGDQRSSCCDGPGERWFWLGLGCYRAGSEPSDSGLIPTVELIGVADVLEPWCVNEGRESGITAEFHPSDWKMDLPFMDPGRRAGRGRPGNRVASCDCCWPQRV